MDWRDKLNGLKSELPQVEEVVSQEKVKPVKKRQAEPLRV